MQRLTIALSTAFIATAFLFPPAVLACGKDPECDDASAWSRFTRVVLSQSYSGATGGADWVASFDHGALDTSIDVTLRDEKGPVSGTVAIVGGRVMMTKGLKLERGYEIDALDAPVLSIQLLFRVLNRVFPKGPDQVSGTVHVDHSDTLGMKFATASASGRLPAPWRVKGKVSRRPDGRIPFELAIALPAQAPAATSAGPTLHMKGELAILGHPVFRDTDLLEGWTTYGVGPTTTVQGGATILDYGATPDAAPSYKTIGDIRAFLETRDSPGVRDTRRDFTGFWKHKCDQDFGLQITHFGDEGKYAIVFCGPGGCDDPAESRLTFITGDTHYEVVTDDILVTIGSSGDRDTYHRCTRETRQTAK